MIIYLDGIKFIINFYKIIIKLFQIIEFKYL
jgi:hypothetical protein